MTDIVVADGYASVGYEYINIDDCWLENIAVTMENW